MTKAIWERTKTHIVIHSLLLIGGLVMVPHSICAESNVPRKFSELGQSTMK
jgi:hypothetical protein